MVDDSDAIKTFTKNVALRIAELRVKSGLTKVAVAKVMGISANNYRRIEHGEHHIRLDTLWKLAQALKVQVPELFEAPGTNTVAASEPRETKARRKKPLI
jgi:transcriptional regulator with XRE-family HTH domain